jgi:hypothetical protein
MARIRRPAPGPWKVKCRQINQHGVGSRCQILDAQEKPVAFSQRANADLAALAPAMLALLLKIESSVRLWHGMLASEHPAMATRPDWMREMEAIFIRTVHIRR